MMRQRFFRWVLGVSALIAGGLSYFASSAPDGLEKVAGQIGFLDSADQSASAASPLAGYSASALGNHPFAQTVAGLAGILAVAALGYLLYLWTRKPAGAGE